MPDENGRVTMAVLATRLDALTEEIRRLRQDVCDRLDDHEARLRDTERRVVAQEQRLGLFTGSLFVLQVIGSAIASWLGMRH